MAFVFVNVSEEEDDDTYGEHFFKKRYEAFADWVKKNLFNSKRDRLLSSRLPEF